MTSEDLAAWLWRCEESFRQAQRGGCPVRYRSALAALQEAERLAGELLTAGG